MARKQTGSKRWANGTWMGRIRDAQGVRTAWCDLGTENEPLALQKLAQWIETGVPPRAKARELFSAAVTRIMATQWASGFAGAGEREQRLTDFAIPLLGHLEVEQIEQHHLKTVLASMTSGANRKARSYAADTVHHMRTDLSRIFKTLVSEGTLRYCVATDLELPEDVEHDARQHKIVSDEHVVAFLRGRGTAGELEMLVLIARWVGGQRPSDIHAGDWSHVDTVNWLTMLVRRPKTEAKEGRKRGHRKGRRRASRSFEFVRHEIPPDVREPLKAWHIAHGSPVSGPIFPARTGKNVGKRKASRGISYAQPFRDALWAEGIVSPLPGYETAVGEARRQFCAYQVDTDETRAADFYSIRRAYITGLALAGVNEQMAMLASGHNGDRSTHRGYLSVDAIALPAAALPMLALPVAPAPLPPPPPAPVAPVAAATPTSARLELVLEGLSALLGRALGTGAAIDPAPGSNEALTAGIDPAFSESFQQRARVDSNHRHSAPEAVATLLTAPKDSEAGNIQTADKPASEPLLTQHLGQTKAGPDPVAAWLDAQVTEAVAVHDYDRAATLLALARKHAAESAAPVISLADARKRRDREGKP